MQTATLGIFMAKCENERLTIARKKTSLLATALPRRDQHPCDSRARVLISFSVNALAVPVPAGSSGRRRKQQVTAGHQFMATQSWIFR